MMINRHKKMPFIINNIPDEPVRRRANMRDQRFIAKHRGGPLEKEQHCQLITWAITCAVHVLPLFGEKPDERLENALLVAKAWAQGTVSYTHLTLPTNREV